MVKTHKSVKSGLVSLSALASNRSLTTSTLPFLGVFAHHRAPSMCTIPGNSYVVPLGVVYYSPQF